MSNYKSCGVPMCKNTTIKTPKKLFVCVPLCPQRRKEWITLARRDPKTICKTSNIFFCEDHFDMPNDMCNYMQYTIMGSVGQIRMRKDCVPTKFHCQTDCENSTSGQKRKYLTLVQDDSEKRREKDSPSTSGHAEKSKNRKANSSKNDVAKKKPRKMLYTQTSPNFIVIKIDPKNYTKISDKDNVVNIHKSKTDQPLADIESFIKDNDAIKMEDEILDSNDPEDKVLDMDEDTRSDVEFNLHKDVMKEELLEDEFECTETTVERRV